MTEGWPPADLPGLRVDLGHSTQEWSSEPGCWLRIPTADYRCACGWTASASGDGVPLISESIADHQPNCLLTEPERDQ